MRMKKFLRAAEAAIGTGLFLLERTERLTPRMRDKVGDQLGDLVDRAKDVYHNAADRAVDVSKSLRRKRRNHSATGTALKFAAGIGVGVGVGLLMAPNTGRNTRHKLAERAQEFGGNLRQRVNGGMVPSIDARNSKDQYAHARVADCA